MNMLEIKKNFSVNKESADSIMESAFSLGKKIYIQCMKSNVLLLLTKTNNSFSKCIDYFFLL